MKQQDAAMERLRRKFELWYADMVEEQEREGGPVPPKDEAWDWWIANLDD